MIMFEESIVRVSISSQWLTMSEDSIMSVLFITPTVIGYHGYVWGEYC